MWSLYVCEETLRGQIHFMMNDLDNLILDFALRQEHFSYLLVKVDMIAKYDFRFNCIIWTISIHALRNAVSHLNNKLVDAAQIHHLSNYFRRK